MKLEKAREILTDYKMESAFEATTDFEDALKLGIEALKGIQAVRQLHPELSPFPLLGETEE